MPATSYDSDYQNFVSSITSGTGGNIMASWTNQTQMIITHNMVVLLVQVVLLQLVQVALLQLVQVEQHLPVQVVLPLLVQVVQVRSSIYRFKWCCLNRFKWCCLLVLPLLQVLWRLFGH